MQHIVNLRKYQVGRDVSALKDYTNNPLHQFCILMTPPELEKVKVLL